MFSCEIMRSIISLPAQPGRQWPKRFLQHSSKIKQHETHCSLICFFLSPSFLSLFSLTCTAQLMTKGSSVVKGQVISNGLLVAGLLTLITPSRVHQGSPAGLLLLQRDAQQPQHSLAGTISPLPHPLAHCPHLGRETKGTQGG